MRSLIFILIILMILPGCNTLKTGQTKEGPETSSVKSILEKSLGNNISNDGFFIQKGKLITKSDEGKITLMFNMKFLNPDSYLVSIRSIGGIEAFRALIRKDTVLINDRINKTLLYGNLNDFEFISGLPAPLLRLIMGDFFVNKPVIKNTDKCINGEIGIEDYYHGLVIRTAINCRIMKPVSVQITTGLPDEFINMKYSKFRDDRLRLPKLIEIEDFRRKVQIRVEIGKYSSPWVGDINFIPGAGYSIKELR